jgi:hypothetical protein
MYTHVVPLILPSIGEGCRADFTRIGNDQIWFNLSPSILDILTGAALCI